MVSAAMKRVLYYFRYWLLTAVGLFIGYSVIDDGNLLAGVFVVAVSFVWFGISLLGPGGD